MPLTGMLFYLRSGDDDFGVDQFLVEFGVGTLLVGRGDQSVPFAF